MRRFILATIMALTAVACSPSKPADQRAEAGTWPPKDYDAFAARPPMSVGAELDDEWTMAIEAERWSYLMGVAIVAAGGAVPPDAEPASSLHLERTAAGLNDAAKRLIALRNLTCGTPPIASAADCAAFTAPPWTNNRARVSKDELQARLFWLDEHAYQFIHPACAVAAKRTGDQNFCTAE